MTDTEEQTLYARMDKVDEMLQRDLSQSARYIWTKHARALKEIRWQKANERIEALARFGGAFMEF